MCWLRNLPAETSAARLRAPITIFGSRLFSCILRP